MKAGARREVVKILRIVATDSASGAEVRERQEAGTERALVRALSGRELMVQGSEMPQADYEFRMTSPTVVTITEADCLEWEGSRFDIASVDMIPGAVPETVIRARRGAAQRNG